ncbi:MAG: hypothetical protein WAN11_25910 [Syntrophobacteraceae bacterium]
MSKPVKIGQSHNLISVLANNVDWETLDGDMIQRIINNPREAGTAFTAFLKNGARLQISAPGILKIDRTKTFDPAGFIGEGWSIVEEDERSLTLYEVDLGSVQFEHMLKDGESRIKGEEKLRRLKKNGFVRLDARIFETLWENQHLIPKTWKEKTNGNTTYIFFDGTILRGPDGYRLVLYLYWRDGRWGWCYYWLGRGWYADRPSAVLAS